MGKHGADLNRQVLASTPCPTPCRARMQDKYPADEGVRLRRGCDAEAVSGRLFLCAGLPRPGRHLQLLRSGADLLQGRLCSAGTATEVAGFVETPFRPYVSAATPWLFIL